MTQAACPVCDRAQLNVYMVGVHLLKEHGWTRQAADEHIEREQFGFVDRVREQMAKARDAKQAEKRPPPKQVDVEVL